MSARDHERRSSPHFDLGDAGKSAITGAIVGALAWAIFSAALGIAHFALGVPLW